MTLTRVRFWSNVGYIVTSRKSGSGIMSDIAWHGSQVRNDVGYILTLAGIRFGHNGGYSVKLTKVIFASSVGYNLTLWFGRNVGCSLTLMVVMFGSYVGCSLTVTKIRFEHNVGKSLTHTEVMFGSNVGYSLTLMEVRIGHSIGYSLTVGNNVGHNVGSGLTHNKIMFGPRAKHTDKKIGMWSKARKSSTLTGFEFGPDIIFILALVKIRFQSIISPTIRLFVKCAGKDASFCRRLQPLEIHVTHSCTLSKSCAVLNKWKGSSGMSLVEIYGAWSILTEPWNQPLSILFCNRNYIINL